MKRAVFLVLCMTVLIISCFAKDQNIIGVWSLYNGSSDYRGGKTYEIYYKYDDYHVKLDNDFDFRAFYDSEAKTLYYVVEGYGPNGPLEKLVFEMGFLRQYTLYQGIWIKHQLYKRQ